MFTLLEGKNGLPQGSRLLKRREFSERAHVLANGLLIPVLNR
jgi:hypothetical protein